MKMCELFETRKRSYAKARSKSRFAAALKCAGLFGVSLLAVSGNSLLAQEAPAKVVRAEGSTKTAGKQVRLSDSLDSPAAVQQFSGSLVDITLPNTGSLTTAIGPAPVPTNQSTKRIGTESRSPQLVQRDKPVRLTDAKPSNQLRVVVTTPAVPAVELRPSQPLVISPKVIDIPSPAIQNAVATQTEFALSDNASAVVSGQGVDLASLENRRPIQRVAVSGPESSEPTVIKTGRVESLSDSVGPSALADNIQVVNRNQPFRLTDESNTHETHAEAMATVEATSARPAANRECQPTANLSNMVPAESLLLAPESSVVQEPEIVNSLPQDNHREKEPQRLAATSEQPTGIDVTASHLSDDPEPLAALPAEQKPAPMPVVQAPLQQVELRIPSVASAKNDGPHPVIAAASDASPEVKDIDSSPTTQVEPIEEQKIHTAGSAEVTPPQTQETRKDLPIREGKSILLATETPTVIECETQILEYSVEDPKTCRIVKTSETKLSLIGLKTGTTRVAFVTTDNAGTSFIDLRLVEVKSTKISKDSKQEIAKELTETIAQIYSTKKVRVIAKGDEFVVEGTAATEKDAMKILSLVRKTTLLPVVDNLKTYYK